MTAKHYIAFVLSILLGTGFAHAQTILNADGVTDTYKLINSVLGGTAYEVPDCAHPDFGPHIRQAWDDTLNEYVFEFYAHVEPDNDRCINFDRQRTEIKTYESSPKKLLGYPGDWVEYEWMFKLPAGFQSSTSFTHIHQIKPVGGDEGNPVFTLSPRKTSPYEIMELLYIDNNNNTTRLAYVRLSDLLDKWVTVKERIFVSPDTNGTYSITITGNKDGKELLSYTNNNILTIRTTNTFIRPKWGIYRSLNNSSDLRDEVVRFADFSIDKLDPTGIQNPVQNRLCVSPNPVSSVGTFSYVLPSATQVNISLFNINGQLVQYILHDVKQSAGEYTQPINVSGLASGIYILRFVTKDEMKTIKLVIKR